MSAQLVAAKACLDFLHTDSVQLTVPLTALQAYCAMTSDVPGWLAWVFTFATSSHVVSMSPISTASLAAIQSMYQPSARVWTSSLSRPSATSNWC